MNKRTDQKAKLEIRKNPAGVKTDGAFAKSERNLRLWNESNNAASTRPCEIARGTAAAPGPISVSNCSDWNRPEQINIQSRYKPPGEGEEGKEEDHRESGRRKAIDAIAASSAHAASELRTAEITYWPVNG